MRLGIDAFNLSGGGGLTHIVEMLAAADPMKYGFHEVVLWGSAHVLSQVRNRSWLSKQHIPDLDEGLFKRISWHSRKLEQCASKASCDVLLFPGGAFATGFKPVVTMCRNMLPFEPEEAARYGLSPMFFKLSLLRWSQSRSFRGADGVIFLTNYAKQIIESKAKIALPTSTVIPHGVSEIFFRANSSNTVSAFSIQRPCRLIYVSRISPYKHQCTVAEAVSSLRCRGFPVEIDFVGGTERGSQKLAESLRNFDPEEEFIRCHGELSHGAVAHCYKLADIAVFASSCENMPNILVESMAAGLPIACSHKGPMPEVLGEGGVYFNPESAAEIAGAIEALILDSGLRAQTAECAYERARELSWSKCADSTFEFLARVAASGQGPERSALN